MAATHFISVQLRKGIHPHTGPGSHGSTRWYINWQGKVVYGVAPTVHEKKLFVPAHSVDYPNHTKMWLDSLHPTLERYNEVTEKVNKRVEGIAEEHGKTQKQLATQVVNNMHHYLNNSDIALRMPPDALQSFLRQQKFRHYFDGGKTKGTPGKSVRASIEFSHFSIHPDTPKDQHVVYGYVNNRHSAYQDTDIHDPLSYYGSAIVILKDHVKDRSTFTVGDSGTLGDTAVPAPYLHPNMYATNWGTTERLADGDPDTLMSHDKLKDTAYQYWETQIHGGLKPSDIDHIILEEQPSPLLEKMLEKEHIQYKVHIPNRQYS